MSDEQVRRDFEADCPVFDFTMRRDKAGYSSIWTEHCFKSYKMGIESCSPEIDRLTLELAECKKDAERYRWLCASDWYIGPEPQGDTNVVSLYNESTDNEGLNLSKEIDAAMEATK